MMFVGFGASAAEYSLTHNPPILPSPKRPHVALRGLGLDPGIQSGLTIIGALVFGAFALTVLGITKSHEKRRT